MNKGMKLMLMILAVSLLFTGCSMRTVDQLYSPPRRSEEYQDLQAAIDQVMGGLEYSAPLSGENQQTVQMADLDGDSVSEFLLFSKGTGEKPLKIFIFGKQEDSFSLLHTIESSGYAFDQVEYVQMDNRPGLEVVIGRQVSEQVLRSVNVYSFGGDGYEALISANYSRFLTCDLDADTGSELMVLHPGQADTDNAVAELYRYGDNGMERSTEVSVSGPIDRIKRIMASKLHDGIPAVYVASAVEENAILTDVFALVGGRFTNISLSNESGTSVQTLRNYYVYANDIDRDGVMELPSLISMRPITQNGVQEQQYLIRWYAMTLESKEISKQYTYHNFLGGWYLRLDQKWAPRVSVEQTRISSEEDQYDFYVWDAQFKTSKKLLTVYALTGGNREAASDKENRFVLHKTENVIFAAQLDENAADYGLTRERVVSDFSMIRMDWKTGET